MRYATCTSGGQSFHRAVSEDGMMPLDDLCAQWPTLLDVIRDGALGALQDAARGQTARHSDVAYQMVLPNAVRILCVGVNFPDRNAEYKDGSEQPEYMPLFPGFASGFTGHDSPLIPPRKPYAGLRGQSGDCHRQGGVLHRTGGRL